MNRKIVLFIVLSVFILSAGTPWILKQNWKQFSKAKEDKPRQSLSGAMNEVNTFNERGEISLKQVIADSARIMFRFPPNSCSCHELDFSEAINLAKKDIGENRVFAVIAAENPKEMIFFRERTKLSCPVYSATDTIFALFEASQTPYACVVFPDMTAQNIVSVNTNNINELISDAAHCRHVALFHHRRPLCLSGFHRNILYCRMVWGAVVSEKDRFFAKMDNHCGGVLFALSGRLHTFSHLYMGGQHNAEKRVQRTD
jgi:hypothetical protein